MEKLLILWWNTKNQGRMKKETIISLSQRTGFSVSTVSRVLSGQAADYRISAKTIALIESEAKRCGYTPSLLAKGLRTNRTHTIGLVVPCIGNPYFAMIASVVTAEAKRLGYTIIIVDSVESEADEQAGIRSLLSHKVDGIIVVPCGNDPSLLESVNAATPVVLIDRHYDNSELSYVCTDNYQGSVEAVRYLVACGHRDILCIRGNLQSSPVKARVKGYLDVLQDAGLAARAMVRGASFSVDNGYLETKLALSSGVRPTAIFAMSNTILLGTIKAVRESGLHVPEDISLVSFDNSSYFDLLDPAITHVSQPINNMGTLAIKILMGKINGQSDANASIELPAQFVISASVKRL